MSISQATFYLAGNPIRVPVWNMGDLSDYATDTSMALFGTGGSSWGSFVSKWSEGTPSGLPDTSNQINTSNTPIYPQVGASYYLSFGASGSAHTYATNGGSINMGFDSNPNPTSDPTQVYLARAYINGVERLGFAIYNPHTYYYSAGYKEIWLFTYQTDANASLNKILELLRIAPSPGNKGFRPIGNRTRDTIGGGDDSGALPGYGTDVLTQPGAPDETHASAVGTGFVNMYVVDQANLNRLGKCLFDGLFSKLNNLFIAPMDYIVSLQVFPYKPLTGASEYIKVLQYSCIAADLSEDSQGSKLTNQFRVVDMGTLSIPEMWNSFLDYDATSFELYLPFIGTVDIPVNEVMNGSINVQYTIDFLTGMCVANVLCTKNTTLSDGSVEDQYAQHSYMGNCAVTIPLCNESFSGIVGSLAQAASACFSGGGLAAAAGSLAMSAASGGFKPTVETKGAISSNAGFCSILQPYISITRPIPAEPDNYQEVIGYPSYIDAVLGTCEGLCVCDNIELSGLAGATDSEIMQIKQICKEGIYI